jgi:hypothetical protein
MVSEFTHITSEMLWNRVVLCDSSRQISAPAAKVKENPVAMNVLILIVN